MLDFGSHDEDISLVSRMGARIEILMQQVSLYEDLEITTEVAGRILVGGKSRNPKAWVGKQRHLMTDVGRKLVRCGRRAGNQEMAQIYYRAGDIMKIKEELIN